MTKRAFVGIVVLFGLLAVMSDRLMSQQQQQGFIERAPEVDEVPLPTRVQAQPGTHPEHRINKFGRGVDRPADGAITVSGDDSGDDTIRELTGEKRSLDPALSNIANNTRDSAFIPGKGTMFANTIDEHLRAVAEQLALKADESPSDQQLAAAIQNYFLANKVESAITVLQNLINESPKSMQATRAKIAIEVLRGRQCDEDKAMKQELEESLQELRH